MVSSKEQLQKSLLEFSEETRRFLLRLGVKTADDLRKIDADYLACNGASAHVLEEARPYLSDLRSAESKNIDSSETPVTMAEAAKHFSRELDDLPIPTKTLSILRHLGVRTIGDLCTLGEEAILDKNIIGNSSALGIKKVLGKIDRTLVDIFEGEADRRAKPFTPVEDMTPETRLLLTAPALNDVPFDAGDLSGRAQHFLINKKLSTIGKILEFEEEGLLKIRNVGQKTANEILESARAQAEKYIEDTGTPLSSAVAEKEFEGSLL